MQQIGDEIIAQIESNRRAAPQPAIVPPEPRFRAARGSVQQSIAPVVEVGSGWDDDDVETSLDHRTLFARAYLARNSTPRS